MTARNLLSSKLTILGLFIFLVFMSNLKYKQWKNQKAIETQKNNLLSQTNQLQKKNNELTESLQYLNSTSFKERVAREQLNLKKADETVYSFGEEKTQITTQDNTKDKVSNFQKWWNYYFANQ